MKNTLESKLNHLLFPKSQSRKIVNDIHEDLCEATSEVEYNKRTVEIKFSWIKKENRFAKNSPPYQYISYFEKFKQEQTKYKLKKFANEKAGRKGTYWHKTVKRSNYLAKDETQSHLRDCTSTDLIEVRKCWKTRI